MGFHEQAGDADGHRRARQHRHEFALTAAAVALPARQLHRMGGVEHHRAAGVAHHREAAHVADQIVVAEAGAALTDHDVVVAGGLGLFDDGLHIPRRQELAFLDVDRFAGGADFLDEIGLAHEECGRLQHVDHARHFVHRRVFVDIGEHRHADLALHFRQHAQPFLHTRAAEAGARRAIGLVEARLEDEGNAQRRGDLFQLAGDIELQLFGLDDAGPGDQEKWLVEANIKATEFHRTIPVGGASAPMLFSEGIGAEAPPTRLALCSRAARIKPMNSGCP